MSRVMLALKVAVEETSSKTSVRGVGFFFLVLDEVSSTLTLRASMTRDISPPEAISCRGLRGSPGLVAMRYSTVSQPVAVQWSGKFPSGAKAADLLLADSMYGLKPVPFMVLAFSVAGFHSGMDGDFEADLHGEGVDLGFGELGELGGGGLALGAEGGGGGAIGCRGGVEFGAQCFEDFVAVFDFGELAGDLLGERR